MTLRVWWAIEHDLERTKSTYADVPVIRLTDLREVVERDPMMKKFLAAGFWDAHHVDLIWRYNGADYRVQADWLKDLWYAIQQAPLKGWRNE